VLAVTGFFVEDDGAANSAFAPLSNAVKNGAADYGKHTEVEGFKLKEFTAPAREGGFYRYQYVCSLVVRLFGAASPTLFSVSRSA
jgi:hypothetical protein